MLVLWSMMRFTQPENASDPSGIPTAYRSSPRMKRPMMSFINSINRADDTIRTSTIHRSASVSARSCVRRRYRSYGIAWIR